MPLKRFCWGLRACVICVDLSSSHSWFISSPALHQVVDEAALAQEATKGLSTADSELDNKALEVGRSWACCCLGGFRTGLRAVGCWAAWVGVGVALETPDSRLTSARFAVRGLFVLVSAACCARAWVCAAAAHGTQCVDDRLHPVHVITHMDTCRSSWAS